MPKLSDAARITTKDNTIWRTCTGCDLLKSLPLDVDRCAACADPDARLALNRYALDAWDKLYRYASLVGRIEAWALLIPDVSDAERLDHIRQALTADAPGKAAD
ncbi:hypothetical protein [Actinoplanes sp. L3-i22]|uniref:hypothetical protein n=1 Tax=Actinoplanes sp. L3-i22 TaxID=2836373 RepID=UPI001C77754C|nr:hypothetical protein [Actinoplanes sp. L3-i22]BCY05411.1 hypothetical protein L3i22_004990 [Actinoplanes sp. L3-i22]